MDELTHIDENGAARMVDVSGKDRTLRTAEAEGVLVVGRELMRSLGSGHVPKGNVYEVARLAGIMGAKRTSELIPLCHPLALTHVGVSFERGDDRIAIHAIAKTTGETGVEMEALTAVTVAGLTLYDMLKALSKEMRLEGVRLLAKSGGRSGAWSAPPVQP